MASATLSRRVGHLMHVPPILTMETDDLWAFVDRVEAADEFTDLLPEDMALIIQAEKNKPTSAEKHLPGKHTQATHGRGGAGGGMFTVEFDKAKRAEVISLVKAQRKYDPAGWQQSRPWDMDSSALAEQPGFTVRPAESFGIGVDRNAGHVVGRNQTPQDGTIHINAEAWDANDPAGRKSLLYHEAGHDVARVALADRSGQRALGEAMDRTGRVELYGVDQGRVEEFISDQAMELAIQTGGFSGMPSEFDRTAGPRDLLESDTAMTRTRSLLNVADIAEELGMPFTDAAQTAVDRYRSLEPEQTMWKHLSGKHDQATHGRKRGAGPTGGWNAEKGRWEGKGAPSPYPDSEGEKVRQKVLAAGTESLVRQYDDLTRQHEAKIDEHVAVFSRMDELRDEMNALLGNPTRLSYIDVNKQFEDEPELEALVNGLPNDKRVRFNELLGEHGAQVFAWKNRIAEAEAIEKKMERVNGKMHKTKDTIHKLLYRKGQKPPTLDDEFWLAQTDSEIRYNKNARATITKANDFLGRTVDPTLYSASHSWAVEDLNDPGYDANRSYYRSSERTVYFKEDLRLNNYVDRAQRESTAVHEVGHDIEHRLAVTGNADRVSNFLNRRAGVPDPNTNLEPLSTYGNYDDDEVATPDEFVSPYVGKRYGDSPRTNGHSEVISMGVQRMYDDPEGFAREDPDHFVFTYNTINRIPDGDDAIFRSIDGPISRRS